MASEFACTLSLFQSTLSVRRATPLMLICGALLLFQSTLSVRRATGVESQHACGSIISIHALREESDKDTVYEDTIGIISIHALREESDNNIVWAGQYHEISIHALREESDSASTIRGPSSRYFNPRSP